MAIHKSKRAKPDEMLMPDTKDRLFQLDRTYKGHLIQLPDPLGADQKFKQGASEL